MTHAGAINDKDHKRSIRYKQGILTVIFLLFTFYMQLNSPQSGS